MNQAEPRTAQPGAVEDLYPTRGAAEHIFERVDPIVYGSGEPRGKDGLSREQRDYYARNGFVVIPGVFAPQEVDLFLGEYQELAGSDTLKGEQELILEPGSEQLRSIFNPHRFSEVFHRLARDHRILDKVTQVLDSEVYVHHGRINIKRALNGKSFPWHSDFETWHAEDGLPRCRVLSAWVTLTENDQFNGPLYLIRGSHRYFVSCAGATPEHHHRASLRKQEYGVPGLESLRWLTAKGGLAAACGPPGTVIVHEGNTMHGSCDNISPTPRTNLFFVYNSVLNTPAEKPFAAASFRPEFLGSRDFVPLRAMDNEFC